MPGVGLAWTQRLNQGHAGQFGITTFDCLLIKASAVSASFDKTSPQTSHVQLIALKTITPGVAAMAQQNFQFFDVPGVQIQLSFLADTAAHNCIVVDFGCEGGPSNVPPTDTQGNTYEAVFNLGTATGTWIAFDTAGGPNTVIALFASGFAYAVMSIREYSGSLFAGTLDAFQQVTDPSPGTGPDTATVTTTAAYDLLILSFIVHDYDPLNPDPQPTPLDPNPLAGGSVIQSFTSVFGGGRVGGGTI
jgi:hypothetical protein